MKTKNLSNMSLVQLQKYKKTKGISYELKQEIEFQISKEEIENKIWVDNIKKTKWFKLAKIQTIRKGSATRILIGKRIVYYLDPYCLVLNLWEIGLKATPAFFEYIDKKEV